MQFVKSFDAVRAFAIILVLLAHLGSKTWLPSSDFFQNKFWHLISGSSAVLMFFCLSGFLLTLSGIEEIKKNKTFNLQNFFNRRFIRVLPAFVIFHLILLLLIIFKILPISFKALGISFIYLYNYVPKSLYYLELGHIWALSVEKQFYLIFGLIFLFIKPKFIGYSLLFLFFLGIIFRIFQEDFSKYFSDYKLNRWFFPAILPILIGCMFAFWYEKLQKIPSLLLFILSCVFYCIPLYSNKLIGMFNFVLMTIGIAFILIFLKKHSTDFKFENQFWKPILYIGKTSFGIYIYQGIFVRTGTGSSIWFQQFPQNVVFTLLLSIISYEFIEKKINQFRKK